MSQLSFRQLLRAIPALTLIALGLLLAGSNGPARAGPILDPLGDFLPTYTGAQDAGLVVLGHEVTLVGDRLNFFGRMAGPIVPTQAVGGLYLIGVDRGLGTPRFLNLPAAPPTIGPNVKWDAIVRILPNGTAFYLNSLLGVTTPLPTSDVSIIGNEFNVSIPVSLMLPSATKPPEEWTYNLWPRNGVGLNVQVSDLAPDDGNSPVHSVPEPASLTACAIGAFGVLGCRWRRRRHTARELVARRQRNKNPMTKHLNFLGIATLSAIALSAAVGARPVNAAPGDIYNLGTLGGTNSTSSGINDAGQVAGSAQDAMGRSRAFLWDSSRGMTDLATADGYTNARANAINASGSVVGDVDDGTGVFHAFAWKPNELNGTTGAFIGLDSGVINSTAADINAAGHVVGSYTLFFPEELCTPDHPYYPNCGGPAYYETHAIIWANGSGYDLSGLLNSFPYFLDTANAINSAGQLAVQSTHNGAPSAFRVDGVSPLYPLGTPGETTSSAINDAGQVVGSSNMTGNAMHAFRYTGPSGPVGVTVDLGTLGGGYSHAFDINDAGFVVGYAQRAAGAGLWATLWQNDAGNTAVDLDAWLDAVNPTLGVYWTLTEARGINNNGLITGQGTYDDGPGGLTDGSRAFVLDASSLTAVPPLLPGDFNGDRVVDGTDFAQWRGDFGVDAGSDADNDLDSDGADFLAWQRQFGSVPPVVPIADAVPEPSVLALAAVATLGMLAFRRGCDGSAPKR